MAEIAIAAAVAAAVSAASYTVQYLLTPKPKAQERGRLQGELQIQDSTYGPMIPVLYGADPLAGGGSCAPGPERAARYSSPYTNLTRDGNSFSKSGGTEGAYDAFAVGSQALDPLKCSYVALTQSEWANTLGVVVCIEDESGGNQYGWRFSSSGTYPIAVATRMPWEDGTPNTGLGLSYSPGLGEVGGVQFKVSLEAGFIKLWEREDPGDPWTLWYSYAVPTDRGYRVKVIVQYAAAVTAPLLVADGSPTWSGEGGGNTVAGNVIYLSDVRPVVTTETQGGKGGGGQTVKTITYYVDIGVKFSEGRQLLQKLFADAEPLLDLTAAAGSVTGLVDTEAEAEPSYNHLAPVDPSDTSVGERRAARYGLSASYDANGVLSGTLKDGSSFRFYQGTEGQPADPLYEAYMQSLFPDEHAAGKVVTPTLHGDCMLFIENFNVSAYGRIPSLRAKLSNADLFEADAIIEDLAERVGLETSDLSLSEVEGLHVRGLPVFNRDGAQEAIATLQLLHGFDLVDSNGELEAVVRGGDVVGTIDYDDLGATDGGEGESEQPVRTSSEINTDLSQLPERIDLSYFDAATDGETGTVGWNRLETDAKAQTPQELNAVLRKDEAERVVRRLLDTVWAEARASRTFSVPHTYYGLRPARAWQVPTSRTASERVRVTEVNGFVPGAFECKGVVESSRGYDQTQIAVTGTAGDANPGVQTPSAPAAPNTSVMCLIDRILRDRERLDGRPGFYVGARGFSSGAWGGCVVKRDQGFGFERVIELTEPAKLGVCRGAVSGGTLDVELYEGGTLRSFTADEVAAGAGYCIAADEIFQYETATQVSESPNLWTLSGVTNEGAVCSDLGCADGDRFAVLDTAFRFVAVESSLVGVECDYIAQSSGQAEADCAVVAFTCDAPDFDVTTPADFEMTSPAGGEILATWTPVSAGSCKVTDGVAYEIRLTTSDGALLFEGNSSQFQQTNLAAGIYVWQFRAKTKYSEGEWVSDSVTVADPTNEETDFGAIVTDPVLMQVVIDPVTMQVVINHS